MRTHLLQLLGGVFLAAVAMPALAADGAPPGRGLTEIPDPELGLMRGRYTVGDNAIAWFGVSMISTWRDASGQTLQGTLALGMDFSGPGQAPEVTFTPSVNITAGDAPPPGAAGTTTRSIDGAGLANVDGMVQSVQVAGDDNVASNVTRLDVRDGSAPARPAGLPMDGGTATARLGGALATASFDGAAARVLLQIDGHGAVEQWIRGGSLGQTIQLSSDRQHVSNRLELDLVRQPLAANAMLVQNVAQAMAMTRGIGPGN